MIEPSDDEKRLVFFGLYHGDRIEPSKKHKAVTWAQNRLREIELENENLRKTIFTISNSPQAEYPGSSEEVYQRRRRERMLDEITLALIKDGLHAMNCTTDEFGHGIRSSAQKLCNGIKEYDAKN